MPHSSCLHNSNVWNLFSFSTCATEDIVLVYHPLPLFKSAFSIKIDFFFFFSSFLFFILYSFTCSTCFFLLLLSGIARFHLEWQASNGIVKHRFKLLFILCQHEIYKGQKEKKPRLSNLFLFFFIFATGLPMKYRLYFEMNGRKVRIVSFSYFSFPLKNTKLEHSRG